MRAEEEPDAKEDLIFVGLPSMYRFLSGNDTKQLYQSSCDLSRVRSETIVYSSLKS